MVTYKISKILILHLQILYGNDPIFEINLVNEVFYCSESVHQEVSKKNHNTIYDHNKVGGFENHNIFKLWLLLITSHVVIFQSYFAIITHLLHLFL